MQEQTMGTEATELSRRSFLGKAGVGVAGLAATSAVLAACSSDEGESLEERLDGNEDGTPAEGTDSDEETVELVQESDLPEIELEMATSWPTSLVTLFGAAQIFAEEVSRLTGGRFKINARPAGEIVGGLEVLPTVSAGGAGAGHTASYYYIGINEAVQFGTAVPFGLTSRQQNAWLYEGGGLEIMRDFYASEFGVIQFPAGNTGVQMGGWFSKEINTVADIQGLTMRIPGIAGQVLNNLGGEQISIAGGDILPSIQTGAIDAAEFVGPTDDLILGLDELGSELFYYHPGWWEPGPSLEVELPLTTWNELPEVYKAAVENAAATANVRTMAKYDVLNPRDLQTIKQFAEIRQFSDEVLSAFKEETENVLDTIAAGNPIFSEILGPWREYRAAVQEWHGLAETSMLTAAAL
ncbi:MAG: ABC transporter substrate-binding protein [Acidimicrobiia bacterium]|nr:ABC transporter substrate-binding protein [Acidimicrobiia bacterium]